MTQKVTIRMTQSGKFKPVDHVKLSELNPKQMLLFAAADCAGRTVLSLLKDRRSAVKNFEIAIEGTLNTPTLVAESRYATFNVVYNIECRTLKEQIDISRAVNLTHDKYCGLIQMLKLIAPVSHQIAITATEEVTA
ncbi:MAG: OsmC family protein [Alistipes sp.]|nr:OsmC family protein [Alistipes sp.]MDE6861184.1 OsmC family protein [Alistipes sp.]